MNYTYNGRSSYTSADETREYQLITKEFGQEVSRKSIHQKLIEIDSFRNAKREILDGDSSPIVKGYLAGDIEKRIEALKGEISEIVNNY